jgi:hypothetical protein
MSVWQRRISRWRLVIVAGLLASGVALSAPASASAAPVAIAPVGASSAAQQAAENLGYDYTYSLGISWPQTALQTPASIMSEVAYNFGYYFPFSSSCSQLPAVGGVCNLYNAGTVNPVQVVERTSTSFTFMSLPGHAEGAYRYIRFTFYKVGTDPYGDLRLQAYAWGPWTAAAWATINSGAANSFWSQFAANVGNAYR